MTSAYLQPSWDAILTGPTSHRRRVSRGWTGGVSVEDAGPSDHALLTAETLDWDA